MKQSAKNLKELRATAEGFLRTLIEGVPKETATVVGLSGDLGTGKTAFTKCVASILGITEIVTSPTFILEKVYIIPRKSVASDRFTKLIHIDAYRLEGGNDMRALDWNALCLDEHNLIFLEWPERVESALPEDMIKISFEYVSEGVRNISIK